MLMNDLILALQNWYASQCNGTWEHSFGVEISNIDNPGWKIKITGTSAKKIINFSSERDEFDWIVVKGGETEFSGYGGLKNLQELFTLAVDWLR
jgi:hypothetical protein